MKTIATPPEADLHAVARGDFSRLAAPLLIAAGSSSQYDEFLWSEGLLHAEARRFREPAHHRGHPENKILLVLPGYELDAKTAGAVEWWVAHEDRYTAQLDRPRPAIETDQRRTWTILISMCLAFWAVWAWMIFG